MGPRARQRAKAHLSAHNHACYKLDKSRNALDTLHGLATEQPKPAVDIPYTRSEYPAQKTASFESQSGTGEPEEVAIAPNMDWHQVKKAEELVRKSGG